MQEPPMESWYRQRVFKAILQGTYAAAEVEFIEEDYRNIRGRFDAFVPLGMAEHVERYAVNWAECSTRQSETPVVACCTSSGEIISGL